MEAFLAKFKALLMRAGEDYVGPAAQANVFQRAAAGSPLMGAIVAAWKHNDGQGPKTLVDNLEEAVADGRPVARQHNGCAKAWAATEAEEPWATSRAASQDVSESVAQPSAADQAALQQWAAWVAGAAAATGPEKSRAAEHGAGPTCYGCGKRGHLRRECPGQQRRNGRGQDRTEAVLGRLEKLVDKLGDKLGGG